MTNVSGNAIKSASCLGATGLTLVIALNGNPGAGGQVFFWLVGIALLGGCLLFLGQTLEDHGRSWNFLLPGAISLGIGVAVLIASLLFADKGAGGPALSFGIAVLIAAVAYTFYHNITNLGVGDGIIVTIIQTIIAALVIAVVLFIVYAFSSNDDRKRRH